jgi:hypothetical protein
VLNRVLVGVALFASVLLGGCTSGAEQAVSPTAKASTPAASASAAAVSQSMAADTSDPSVQRVPPIGWVSTSNNGLSFRYPPQWRFYPYMVGGSMVSITGYLSTEVLHEPCKTTKVSGGSEVTCGPPLSRLEPNGVLITFGGPDGPYPEAAAAPNPNSRIAGQPAVLTRGAAAGSCLDIGGSYEIRVLARGGLSAAKRQIQLEACISGPDTETAQHDFDTLLRTVAYTHA